MAVGHEQTVWLSAVLLTLPVHQPLLASPAPPLTSCLLVIIIIPGHPGGDKDTIKNEDKQRSIFLLFLYFSPALLYLNFLNLAL